MPLRAFAYRLSPVELGFVCGQDWLVDFSLAVGYEDRRFAERKARLIQGQQYPCSPASKVFPADKQNRRIRAYGLKHVSVLVEAGDAGLPYEFSQGRNTLPVGLRLRLFDGPQLAEE